MSSLHGTTIILRQAFRGEGGWADVCVYDQDGTRWIRIGDLRVTTSLSSFITACPSATDDRIYIYDYGSSGIYSCGIVDPKMSTNALDTSLGVQRLGPRLSMTRLIEPLFQCPTGTKTASSSEENCSRFDNKTLSTEERLHPLYTLQPYVPLSSRMGGVRKQHPSVISAGLVQTDPNTLYIFGIEASRENKLVPSKALGWIEYLIGSPPPKTKRRGGSSFEPTFKPFHLARHGNFLAMVRLSQGEAQRIPLQTEYVAVHQLIYVDEAIFAVVSRAYEGELDAQEVEDRTKMARELYDWHRRLEAAEADDDLEEPYYTFKCTPYKILNCLIRIDTHTHTIDEVFARPFLFRLFIDLRESHGTNFVAVTVTHDASNTLECYGWDNRQKALQSLPSRSTPSPVLYPLLSRAYLEGGIIVDPETAWSLPIAG
ncbi:hypothetical protein GMRT_11246 [Giardia muris]|uniref:Uncharacterized protein n=1 Tax=Giardia muris TaxID=5742 RepID=A0A4Z1T5C8_GIAMU|nr:hypothetical protein GMRT_11246 [Giardia muris]|eukprot:TNJ28307.1 hypothetical protein GMRT_11246 [Giardia muris]